MMSLLSHYIAAEEIVLGTIIINSASMKQVAGVLHPVHFYVKLHGQLFDLMYNMFDSNVPIDIVTVAEISVRSGIFNSRDEARMYAYKLAAAVINPSAIADYARIIIDRH
jgi:replicative DNA helicase